MKKAFLFMIICVLSQIIKAQTTSDIGKIVFSVIMPENLEGLDALQLSKLETKITQIVTNCGIGASGVNNSFVIYPQFSIYESNVLEGGMQNITVVKSELNLFIKQVDNNIIFSSISKPITGSGNSKFTAVTNVLSKIDVNDIEYKKFVETGKIKIIKYFENKCSDIIIKSENLAKRQDYEQALYVLMSVPEDVSCYANIQEKSIEVFKAYQSHKCKVLLNELNLNIASKNYAQALENLSLIDPSSSCFKEAEKNIQKIENKIDDQQKKHLAIQMLQHNDQIALEKQRIDAVKEIAISYYKNRPAVQYNYIIR